MCCWSWGPTRTAPTGRAAGHHCTGTRLLVVRLGGHQMLLVGRLDLVVGCSVLLELRQEEPLHRYEATGG